MLSRPACSRISHGNGGESRNRRSILFQSSQILARCAGGEVWRIPINRIITCSATSTIGIGFDDAGINREAFTLYQSFGNEALQNGFEYMPECVALTDPARRFLEKPE